MPELDSLINTILEEAPELSDYVVHCRSRGNMDSTIERQLDSLVMLRRACDNKKLNDLSLDDVKHGLARLRNEPTPRLGSKGRLGRQRINGGLAPETYRHRVAHAKKYYEMLQSPIAETLSIPKITAASRTRSS